MDSGHFDPVAADPEEAGGLHARPSAPASKFEGAHRLPGLPPGKTSFVRSYALGVDHTL